ncbi:MAG: helix-turn-helix domain-containing protein [Acidobacteriia bacterium]|nr:helix-turn-helix domain-containing protein [Terriglobia bacterium]
MTELAQAIAELRHRNGWSTTEMARHLGVSHSSVSRYESGKMDPGILVLERLFWLAAGSEKKPIKDALEAAMNAKCYPPLAEEEEGADIGILRIRERRVPRPNLSRFAEIANAVISAGDEIDPAVLSILQLWLEHRTSLDPKIRGAFDDAARFLRVAIASRRESGGEGERRRKAMSSPE